MQNMCDKPTKWEWIGGLFGGQAHVHKMRLKRYAVELERSKANYESCRRSGVHHPYSTAPHATERHTHHNIAHTRYSNNPTIPVKKYETYDHLCSLESERLQRKANARASKKPYDTHDIWKVAPITLPPTTPGSSPCSSGPSTGSASCNTRAGPPKPTVASEDEENFCEPTRPSAPKKHLEPAMSWCGPRREPTKCTKTELHLARSEIWDKQMKRAANGSRTAKRRVDQSLCFNITENHVLFSDGHYGSPAENLQEGFHIRCDPPSTAPSTPMTSTPPDGKLSSRTSTGSYCDSDTAGYKTLSDLKDMAVSPSTRGCHEAMNLQACLDNEVQTQHRHAQSDTQKRVSFDLGSESGSEHSQTDKCTSQDQRKGLENRRHTKRVSFASDKKSSYGQHEQPPSFITRTLHDIGRPDEECMPSCKSQDSAFAKMGSVTSRQSSVSLISRSLSASQQQQKRPRFGMRGPTYADSSKSDGHDHLTERQRVRADCRASQVLIQEADDCSEGIASDSEDEDANGTFDEVQGEAPTTSKASAVNKPKQKTITTPRVTKSTNTKLPSKNPVRGTAEWEAARQEVLQEKFKVVQQKMAKKAETAMKATAAKVSFEKFQAEKRAQEARKAKEEKREQRKKVRHGHAKHVKPVVLPDTPVTAHRKALRTEEAAPFDRFPRPLNLGREATLEELSRRVATPCLPEVGTLPNGNRARYTDQELAEERSRGQRWGPLFVYPVYDTWTQEALRTNPATRDAVLEN